MADRTPEVRKAMIAALRADAGVAALVGARIYDRGVQDGAFPYLHLGAAVSVPFDAEALRGSEISQPVHCVSAGPARIEALKIAAAVSDALHWRDLTLESGEAVLVRRLGTRQLDDPDGVRVQAIVEFEIITDG